LNEASAQFIFDLVSTRTLLQVYLTKLCIIWRKKKGIYVKLWESTLN
jgi:hypothetical protein